MRNGGDSFGKRWLASIPGAIVVAVFAWWRMEANRPPVPDFEPPRIYLPPMPAAEEEDASVEVAPFEAGPSNADVSGVVEDAPLAFRWARASITSDGLVVRLRTQPIDPCVGRADAPRRGMELEIVVPPGPNGDYYVERDVGVPVTLRGAVHLLGRNMGETLVWPDRVVVHLDRFARASHTTVHGTVSLEGRGATGAGGAVTTTRLRGSFDAVQCDWYEPTVTKLPGAAPAGLVAGTIAGKKLATASAVAFVSTNEIGAPRFVHEIRFYPQAGVTCERAREPNSAFAPYSLYVDRIGGSGADHPILGSPQPASGGVYIEKGDSIFFSARASAWVKLDAVAFEENGRVRGSVYAASAPGGVESARGWFGGSFDAVVCVDR